jgi:hypothetical protein
VLLHARQGLAWPPVLAAFAAAAAGATTVAALSMAASLYLPRIATLLLLLMGVAAVAGANVAALLGAQLGGFAALLDGYGPPLVSSLAVALRHGVWMLASAALLMRAFQQQEIE